MKLQEIHSFKLSDAIKFHNQLNPKLWVGTSMKLKVRTALMKIAKDFIDYLGIDKIKVKDIIIIGSNVGYTYTEHSDIDLHILIDFTKLNDDEIYRELFDSKKMLYNDSHNIKIFNIDVECYVQDSNVPAQSLGEFSVLNNKWVKMPVKRRANIDHINTKLKYEKLSKLADYAAKIKDSSMISRILQKISKYRKAGLAKGGEMSPENLAYKILRNQGYIEKLYKHRDLMHGRELSIENMYFNESYSPVLSMYVNNIKKQIIESRFDYNNIPPIEEYRNNNEVRDKLLQRIFRYCWDNWECTPKLHEHIISNIETKIWKQSIYESHPLDNVLSNDDIKKFIHSLWSPIPSNNIKPGMTIDILEVQNPAGNILKLSVKENKTVAKVQYNANEAVVLFTDGDVTISNFETFDSKYGAYFFTKAKEAIKGITWIALKTERVNGYRKYNKFLIDLPNEGPYDRIISNLNKI